MKTQIELMKIALPTIQKETSLLMFSVFILFFFSTKGVAQTQKPSVTTGVTFQWADTQTTNNDPAT